MTTKFKTVQLWDDPGAFDVRVAELLNDGWELLTTHSVSETHPRNEPGIYFIAHLRKVEVAPKEIFVDEIVKTMRAKSFNDVIKSGDYVILDTETTGLYDAEICQIAIIDSDGQPLLDTLVKTTRPIPTDAQAIHGISTEMVKNSPTYAELAPRIKEILTGRDVIVYNAIYDRKMLHQSAEKVGIEKVEWKEVARWWCAMEAFAPIFGQWNARHGSYKWQTLTTAARHYSVTVKNAHTALGDCLMTLGVVKAMVK